MVTTFTAFKIKEFDRLIIIQLFNIKYATNQMKKKETPFKYAKDVINIEHTNLGVFINMDELIASNGDECGIVFFCLRFVCMLVERIGEREETSAKKGTSANELGRGEMCVLARFCFFTIFSNAKRKAFFAHFRVFGKLNTWHGCDQM